MKFRVACSVAAIAIMATTVVSQSAGNVAWRVNNVGSSTMTVASGITILAGSQWLEGYNATGNKLYNATLPSAIDAGPWSCPQSQVGNAFMVLANGERVGVKASTGEILWRRADDESQYTFCSSRFPESYFNFGPGNGFYRIDTHTGARHKIFTVPNCSLYFLPSTSDDYAAFACDSNLYSYRLADGKLQFNATLYDSPSMTQVDNFLFVDDGIFYFADTNGTADAHILLVKLSVVDGSIKAVLRLENSFAPYFYPASTGYIGFQPDLFHMSVFSTADLSLVCNVSHNENYFDYTLAYPLGHPHAGDFFIAYHESSSTSKSTPIRFHSADCSTAWTGPTRCGERGGVLSGAFENGTKTMYTVVTDCWTNNGNTEEMNLEAIWA